MNTPENEIVTFQLQGLAMNRFAINWTAFLLIVVGVSIWFIQGFPEEWTWELRLLASCVIMLFLYIAANFIVPVIWKIEIDKDKLVFCGLFYKKHVRWNELEQVSVENWGQENFYRITLKSGGVIRFPEGLDKQKALLGALNAAIDGNKLVGRAPKEL